MRDIKKQRGIDVSRQRRESSLRFIPVRDARKSAASGATKRVRSRRASLLVVLEQRVEKVTFARTRLKGDESRLADSRENGTEDGFLLAAQPSAVSEPGRDLGLARGADEAEETRSDDARKAILLPDLCLLLRRGSGHRYEENRGCTGRDRLIASALVLCLRNGKPVPSRRSSSRCVCVRSLA